MRMKSKSIFTIKIPVINEYKGFLINNLKVILEGSCVDCQQI